MSIETVKIENFTVFQNIEVGFASGMNVLIGENGTGKTHLMKMLYAMLNVEDDNLVATIGKYYDSDNYIESLTETGKDVVLCMHSDSFALQEQTDFLVTKHSACRNPRENEPAYTISHGDNCRYTFSYAAHKEKSVFIPAKDMLTHSNGMLEMARMYGSNMPFDKTLLDIIEVSKRWKLDQIPALGLSILPKLEEIIDGKVVLENDVFYIKKNNGQKVKFSVEAEGIKKIATLWQLIMNDSITKGGVLIWDEPEANINPKLVPVVVDVLLELSRNGVQVFVATHDYIFAKYIEVLMQDEDAVAFHALYKTNEHGVQCETATKFSLLYHNAMREENINLYDAEMKKEFEE